MHFYWYSGFTPIAVLFLCGLCFPMMAMAPERGANEAVAISSGVSVATPEALPVGLHPILDYIESAWDGLTRSLNSCAALADPKTSAPGILYLPSGYSPSEEVKKFTAECADEVHCMPANERPHPGSFDPHAIDPPGLLYLEHPYVVPGGRFNEMYGWDSYFIIRGLVEDDRIPLAKGMVENFFFELEHYGAILNANRTYYLSRSQPPFLTEMILTVYGAQAAIGEDDRDWLARGYGYAQRDYAMWTSAPHLAGSTGLSRYFDFGDGPAPEELNDDPDYYRTVAAYFEKHTDLKSKYLVAADENSPEMPDILRHFAADTADPSARATGGAHRAASQLVLSADFYKGDRAMRESGFDDTFRFEPYGAATHHFAPVCLNSLLYNEEKNLEEIARILGRNDESRKWGQRAEARRAAVTKYLWNEKRGMFFDYDFTNGERSNYDFATTFYPLWTGLATPEQAEAVEGNLKVFERPGGLTTSTTVSGVQWDEPYAWAPLQLIAVEGLRRYGFTDDANRIAYEFLSMVHDEFRRDGTIREKYDAVNRTSKIHVEAGYDVNVIGFGWTNGVFLVLLHRLPSDMIAKLAQ
jgi:alpha,alpha-trehalase